MGVLIANSDRSYSLGNFLVIALRILNQEDQGQLDYWVTQQEGSIQKSVLYPKTSTQPNVYLAAGQTGWSLALIDGCKTLSLAAALLDGYTPPITGGFPTFANSWAESNSDSLKSIMDAGGLSGYPFVTCAGHSGGGVIACLLADKIKAANPANSVRWQTFGQPKTSWVDRSRIAIRTPGVRWMWHADPIPLVPPAFSDAPFLLPIIGLRAMIAWSQMTQWEGGYQLVPGQTGHPEELPTTAAISPFQSISSWLLAAEQGAGTNHSISDYEGFMRAEQPFQPQPTTNLRSVAPVETPPSRDRRAETQAEAAAVASIVNAEHAQNAVPVSIPEPKVWQAVRQGRIWIVTFGGVPVVVSATRRSARGLARQMNDSFRRLQRSPVVDPNAMTSQLQAYLAAASDPAGGFVPVMNTTF